MSKFLVGVAVATALAASSHAQVTRGRLIGFASDSASTLPPHILQQAVCNPGNRVCPSPLPAPAVAYAGGAAYSAFNRSVWHTQGTRIVETGVDSCQLVCAVAANLVLGPGSVATGLEVCESRYEMLQLESVPGAAALSTWHIRSCPPAVIGACRIQLPSPQHVAGAVALDERHGLVLYATSIFGAVLPANQVLVARDTDPCTIVCRFDAPGCGNLARLGAITGMAYDACDQLLYLTDGSQTAIYSNRVGTTPCDFQAVGCCGRSPGLGGFVWHGLDVEPRHPLAVGASCVGRGCPNCAAMALSAAGDPAVGNPRFAIELSNAPTNGFFQLGLAAGPCRPVGLPIFCGSWHTDLATLVLLPFVSISGNAICDGAATIGLPIPKDYALCGAALCAQGIVICAPVSLPPAVGLTNALELVID
ncbi:MAG: hypothetical protein R3F56_17325 [Planctomycetota bacterium]